MLNFRRDQFLVQPVLLCACAEIELRTHWLGCNQCCCTEPNQTQASWVRQFFGNATVGLGPIVPYTIREVAMIMVVPRTVAVHGTNDVWTLKNIIIPWGLSLHLATRN
jgi:hypothetical protein